VGLIVKPITGIFDFLKHTSEGVSAGTNIDPTVMTEPRRISRMLYGTDRILRPYRIEDARCKQILARAGGGKWENVRTLDIVLGHLTESRTQVALLCTDEHLVCLDLENETISFVMERSTVEKFELDRGHFYFDAMGKNKELLTFSMDLTYSNSMTGRDRQLHYSDADAMVVRIRSALRIRQNRVVMSHKCSHDSFTDGYASSNPDEDGATGRWSTDMMATRSRDRLAERVEKSGQEQRPTGAAGGRIWLPNTGDEQGTKVNYTEDQMRRANQRKQDEFSDRFAKKTEEEEKQHEE